MKKVPWPEKCVCGTSLGEPHNHGCDWEECPFCREQLNSCNCDWPLMLNMTLIEDRLFEKNGFNDEQAERWDRLLKEKGVITWGDEQRLHELYTR